MPIPQGPSIARLAFLVAAVIAAAIFAPGDASAQRRDGPSFNCRNAGTPTEYAICDSRELSRLDREMANLYFSVRDAAGPRRRRLIENDQANWLAERDGCYDDTRCLRAAYGGRIGELSVMADDYGGGHGPVPGRPPRGGRETVWDHNGSEMLWSSRGPDRVITYLDPRRGLSARPGDVLFEGRRDGNRLTGTAYAFRRGCPPAGYHVEGIIRSETNVTLRGAAPVRARGGCQVVGYDPRSSNATLRFRYLQSTR